MSSIFRPTTDAESNSVIDVAKIFAEWTATEFQRDYEAQADYIQSATETVKNQKGNIQPHYTCATRGDTEAGSFLPVFAAQLTEANPTATYEGACFEEIEFSLMKSSDTTFDINMHL